MNRFVPFVGVGFNFGIAVAVLVASAASLAAPPTYRDAVGAANPILWYRFDEPAGGIANHGSLGSGWNAVISGAVTRRVPSPGGGGGGGDAASGFGIGNFAESMGASPLIGNPTFSIEAVVRLDSPAAAGLWGPFLHWGDGGASRTGREVYFGIQNANNRRNYAGFYNAGVRTVQDVPVNDWIHIVWTRQGGGDSESGSTVYVNGTPVVIQRDFDLTPGFVPAAGVSINATTFRINAGRDLAGLRYFTGALDELALYDRLLTPGEIAQRAVLALCLGDFNHDGFVNSQDFFDFLGAFFGLEPAADFNDDGAINSQDFFDFLGAFFAGC